MRTPLALLLLTCLTACTACATLKQTLGLCSSPEASVTFPDDSEGHMIKCASPATNPDGPMCCAYSNGNEDPNLKSFCVMVMCRTACTAEWELFDATCYQRPDESGGDASESAEPSTFDL